MSRRALVSAINLGFLGGTIVVWFLFPQYDVYALYALAGWVVVGLAFAWSNRRPRPAGVGPAGTGPSVPSTSSGPTPPGTATAPIDFCIYCGTRFGPGERQCAACGHPLPQGTAA